MEGQNGNDMTQPTLNQVNAKLPTKPRPVHTRSRPDVSEESNSDHSPAANVQFHASGNTERVSEETLRHLATLESLEANNPKGVDEKDMVSMDIPGNRQGIWDSQDKTPRTPVSPKTYENWVDEVDELESAIGTPTNTRHYNHEKQ